MLPREWVQRMMDSCPPALYYNFTIPLLYLFHTFSIPLLYLYYTFSIPFLYLFNNGSKRIYWNNSKVRLSRTEPVYCCKLEGMLSWAPGPQYVLRGASKCKLDGAPVYSEGPRYVYSLSTLYTVHTSHSIIQWAMSGQRRFIVLCQRVRVLVHTLYTLHTMYDIHYTLCCSCTTCWLQGMLSQA